MASEATTTVRGRSKDKTTSETVAKASASHEGDDGKDTEDRDSSYFQYYALLSHQAQMLQDGVRTTAYQKAILSHAAQCFKDKIVIDVGAGNGILSVFAAQAGAKQVYAIEASNMVKRLQNLVDAAKPTATGQSTVNPWLADRVIPIGAKMEEVTADFLNGTQQVDTIVSECLGVLLVHERMCESFLDARDRFLKPGGSMLPSSGTICLAPIEDKVVWEEAANKARFWSNSNFYGVDITPFSEAAWDESFSSPVVGCFGPLIVLTPSNDYTIDFQTISKQDLKRFTIPLSFEMTQTAVIHGLGGWFDLYFLPMSAAGVPSMHFSMPSATTDDFNMSDLSAMADLAVFGGSTAQDATGRSTNGGTGLTETLGDPSISSTYMTTSPYTAPTHWQQVRFLLREPLAVNKGQKLVGTMLCEVNEQRSYTLTADLQVEGSTDAFSQRTCQWRLDRQVYSWTSAAPAPQ